MNFILNHFNQFLWIILWSAIVLNALIIANWIELRFDTHIDRKMLKTAVNEPKSLSSYKLYYEV